MVMKYQNCNLKNLKSCTMQLTTWICLAVLLASLGSNVEAGRQKVRPFIVNRWFDMPGYSSTPFNDCGSQGSALNKVEVIPCGDDDACILPRGKNATFNLSFMSKINSTSLKTVVHGIVAGVPVPFHVPHSNACTDCGIDCPLQAGKQYNYSVLLPILKSYPRLSVTVKWELLDEHNRDVVCVQIPARLR